MPELDSDRALPEELAKAIREGDLAAAKERNMFVMQSADQIWVPYATPGGMLARLLVEREAKRQ